MTFVAPRNKTNRFLLDKNYCQFNMMVFMSQVLTNIVGAIAESARSHENRREGWTCRKWKWTTVAIVTQKQKSEENKHCRELIREQEGLGPVIRLIASTSPGAESIAMLELWHCNGMGQVCWWTWLQPLVRWQRTPAAWNRSVFYSFRWEASAGSPILFTWIGQIDRWSRDQTYMLDLNKPKYTFHIPKL